jgi:hypothetical protein
VLEYDKATGEMVETGEYKFDSAGANKALALLTKYKGVSNDFEADRLELTGKNGGAIQVEFKVQIELIRSIFPVELIGHDPYTALEVANDGC